MSIDIRNLSITDVSRLAGLTKPTPINTCPDCGDTYEADDLTTVIHNEEQSHVCQACIDVDYQLCEGCRNYIHREDRDNECPQCRELSRREQAEAMREEEMERRVEEWRLEGGRLW